MTIDISHTAIGSIEMLSNLKSLRAVNLVDTPVRDISPLRDLPQLSSVTASPDALTDKTKEEFRAYRRSKGLNEKLELIVR
jgi:Leucine-rich repeat (LRR) protein